MESDEDWKKPEYKNWVRGAKGLEYLQKGLQTRVAELVLRHRDHILHTIVSSVPGTPSQCNQCTGNNLLPEHAVQNHNRCLQRASVNCLGGRRRHVRRVCPNGLCSKLYDEIVKFHRFKDPVWKDTDLSTWCTDTVGWSFAKCFQTTPNPGTSSSETDAAGLLSIIINDTFFQNEVGCNLAAPNNYFSVARETRNNLLHSPKMEVDDTTLQDYINTFIAVLQDRMFTDVMSGEALQNLVQLKNNEITISFSEEVKLEQVRKEALVALEQLQDKIQEGVNEIAIQAQEAQVDIKETKYSALEQLQEKKEEGVSEIATQLQEAQVDIKETKSSAYEQLEQKTGECVTEITTQAQQAQVDIQQEKSSALQQLQEKKEEVVSKIVTQSQQAQVDIQQEKSSALEQLQEKKEEVVGEIAAQAQQAQIDTQEAKSSALEQLQMKKVEGVDQIETQIQHCLIDIKNEKSSALGQLEGKIVEGVSEIATQTQQAKTELKEATFTALNKISKDDIHERLGQTEETIQHLAIQQKKMEKEIVRQAKFQAATSSGESSSDEAYRQLKTKLRNELIEYYRSQHSTFHLSPILDDEEHAPLLEFYVMPEINVITLERAFGGGSEKKTQIPEFRSVFFKEGRLCSEIYMTADAGFGKTSFSKRIALAWCHAQEKKQELAKAPNSEHAKDRNSEQPKEENPHHAKGANLKENKYLGEKEVKTMDEFDFLFLIFLRDSKKDCHIIDMVMNQIIQELELKNISRDDLQRILYTERSLVILDGLDEWYHPENSCKRTEKAIPHRKAKQCTILTTTRPWKLSDVKASQIDQKLEIAGLSEKSADCLKERVIPHLCGGKEAETRIREFSSRIKEKKLTNLVKIPIMLMYFLCLFCENRELGRSSCMLYSNITDMLLYKSKKQKGVLAPHSAKYNIESTSEIPLCFKENKYCKEFYPLLTALGTLAFHTLLVETKEENTLVFNKSVVRQFLKEKLLRKFCLKTGILTQSIVRGKLIKPETKVSFAHKTVQEFFAALYSTIDSDAFQEKVLSKCKCVKAILEMSKVLIFVSGFNEKLSSLILSRVINIVNNDPITQEYRNTIDPYSSSEYQLKEFQDLCVSCCKEFTSGFQHNLCLQNVFIDKSCQEEEYLEILKQLTARNRSTQGMPTRSLYIYMFDMYQTPYNSTQKVIDYFVLRDLVNIEKIHYEGKCSDEDILPLLKSSVKSLFLQCIDSWSHLLFEKVKSLQKLEAIYISLCKMSHRELKQFSDYISHRDCMKEIVLVRLSCTDHEEDSCTDHEEDSSTDHEKYSCTGLCVQTEQHEQLRVLTLEHLPVTEVVVNMSSLEKCRLYDLCNPDLVLKFINYADCKLEAFYCSNLKSSAAIDTVLDTLPLLHHVRHVGLLHINLGRRKLTLSPQVNIERLDLYRVTMEASTLRELVDCVHKLPQPVTVNIWKCTISPVEEFNTVKEKIKTSQRHFRILEDDGGRFEFATIKD